MVTGGAGYIGSHVVRLLVEASQDVIVVDDLSTGSRQRLPDDVPLEVLDLAGDGAIARLTQLMQATGTRAVIHIAARKQVGESMQRPAWYYSQNVGGMANLLQAMRAAGAGRLVFSSSAAVYGTPEDGRATEQTPTVPINPYGQTKLVGEWMAAAESRASGMRSVSLRYFNVAGTGWPELADTQELNLIPIALGRAVRGEPVLVFGNDYPTPDGTCVRDYIHVLDLASAHLMALRHLDSRHRNELAVNLGTGGGHSVREVLDAIDRVTGQHLKREIGARRAGDPATLVADASLAADAWGWKASRGLDEIARSAWDAHRDAWSGPQTPSS